ncbi:uncharacterized protein M6B38_398545 [Iris pallida]|uniref:BZIP domain-containing protein n=1 Tax=Iris pallida TaxID=29817 RepID=A0AAX6FU53_IRIPA|nr:uncharacterized protein M6B38_398545 [Iris pallida]
MASSARHLTAPIYPPLDFDPHPPKGRGSATPSPASSSMDDLFGNISTAVSADPDGDDLFAKADAGAGGGVTLEEYLSKDEIRVPGGYPADLSAAENPAMGFGGGGGRGRGRKRPVMDPVDRAALQRQKRMIKNRESAARSRERKQAYTVELESLVTQLEEENARLVREQEELRRKRLKQLMENVVPVTENKRPARSLRRTQSMQW